MSQCRVALLGKGMAIPCAVRLALTHLRGSENDIISRMDH
jgi:hypothetical protein